MPATPESPGAPPPKPRFILTGLVLGTLLTLSPLFGTIGTVVGMMNSFKALSAGSTPADPEALSSSVRGTLIATAAGLVLFIPGVILLIVSIIRYRRAKRAAFPPSALPGLK